MDGSVSGLRRDAFQYLPCTPQKGSKGNSCGLALLIIGSVGGLLVGGIGIAGFCHVGALGSLNQVQAIIMMATGGALFLASIIICIVKNRINSCQSTRRSKNPEPQPSITTQPSPKPPETTPPFKPFEIPSISPAVTPQVIQAHPPSMTNTIPPSPKPPETTPPSDHTPIAEASSTKSNETSHSYAIVTFDQLPEDIHLVYVRFLSVAGIVTMSQVNTTLRALLQKDVIWRHLCEQHPTYIREPQESWKQTYLKIHKQIYNVVGHPGLRWQALHPVLSLKDLRVQRPEDPEFTTMLTKISTANDYTLLSIQETKKILSEKDATYLFSNLNVQCMPTGFPDITKWGQLNPVTLRYVARQRVNNCVFEIFSYVDLLISVNSECYLTYNDNVTPIQLKTTNCRLAVYATTHFELSVEIQEKEDRKGTITLCIPIY